MVRGAAFQNFHRVRPGRHFASLRHCVRPYNSDFSGGLRMTNPPQEFNSPRSRSSLLFRGVSSSSTTLVDAAGAEATSCVFFRSKTTARESFCDNSERSIYVTMLSSFFGTSILRFPMRASTWENIRRVGGSRERLCGKLEKLSSDTSGLERGLAVGAALGSLRVI